MRSAELRRPALELCFVESKNLRESPRAGPFSRSAVVYSSGPYETGTDGINGSLMDGQPSGFSQLAGGLPHITECPLLLACSVSDDAENVFGRYVSARRTAAGK